jgi:uncharacterized protein YbaR (Trm112 family)
MHIATLDILRCPYCGGRLALVDSMFHRRDGDRLQDGILGCHCCIFPLVDGIPVLHLHPAAVGAREQIEAGHPNLARRTMIGIENERDAEAFEAAAASPAATYRETVEAIGPNFEGGYFLYRFTDPTFVVADALLRAVAGTVLEGSGRAIDICGGSGHLTRTLLELSTTTPVLADLYFAKIWLARRFTAPGCEPVCCDGNAPLPFAAGSFRFAMCTDAFMFIWTKRQFVGEMARLIGSDPAGAMMIGHTHNQRVWSPSHGQPLTPEGYADLFETVEPRIFGEAALFDDVVAGGPLDLSRRESKESLDCDPALSIVATRHPGIFRQHPIAAPSAVRGQLRLNPLYAIDEEGERLRLRLRFPSDDYEQEYGACRRYLPDEATIDRTTLAQLESGRADGQVASLLRSRVVVDLPKRYY